MIPPNVRPAEPPRLPSLEDIQNIKTQNAKLNTVDNSIHNIGTRLKRENEEVIQACDEKDTQNSFIYCSGKLLESVMYHELYNDSKTYVDKPLRFDPNQTIADFLAKFPMDVKEIKKAELRQFVDQYFFEDGHELDDCILEDWTEHPAPLKNIQDNDLREWAYQLNGIWKDLCRKTKPDVYANPQRYSLIALPHEFIVPGQRFQESYYWDTYWIIKGLLRSNMTSTAKKMIQNFFHIVKTYGYVLNGNRYYYARRSQPPFLSFMVKDYFDATQDVDFLFEALPVLEKEMSWWEQNRMISVSVNHHDYDVFRFRADSNVPRPESYFQDVNTTSKITDLQEKHRVWRDISSAAESGWDFSSRWLRNTSDESSFDTSNIAPVDLNAILCGAYSIIGDLYEYIGYSLKSDDYKSKKEKFRETFSSVFWGANNTGWYDYHVDDKRHNTEFYPSNAVPLFTKCYGPMEEEHLVEIYSRMKSQGAFEYPGE
uniref:Trehalase n=1 Tax=Rhabditophanes sp. KR3021 TaxID=114890 RepID=A0AC35TH43_9BILA